MYLCWVFLPANYWAFWPKGRSVSRSWIPYLIFLFSHGGSCIAIFYRLFRWSELESLLHLPIGKRQKLFQCYCSIFYFSRMTINSNFIGFINRLLSRFYSTITWHNQEAVFWIGKHNDEQFWTTGIGLMPCLKQRFRRWANWSGGLYLQFGLGRRLELHGLV